MNDDGIQNNCEHEQLIFKTSDGISIKVFTPPKLGWTHELIERVYQYIWLDKNKWINIYLGSNWFSNSDIYHIFQSDIDKSERKFEQFLNVLQREVNLRDLNYDGAADDPNFEEQSITLSFNLEDESRIDDLIRHVRDYFSNDYYIRDYLSNLDSEDTYPIAVWKAYIHSSPCWSVLFYFSYDRGWQFHEDTQA